MRIAIIGAGMSGVACAHRLVSQMPEAEIFLLERNHIIGGNIKTLSVRSGSGGTHWGADDHHELELGVIEIFPWYHTFLQLLTDLHLMPKFQPIPVEQILFEDSVQRQFPRHYIRPFRLTWRAIRLLPLLLRSAAYYVLSSRKRVDNDNTTMEDVLDLMYGPNNSSISRDYVESTTYIQSYTYPPADQLASRLFLPLVLRGGDDDCYLYKPNLGYLLNEMVKSWKNHQVHVMTNCLITNVKQNQDGKWQIRCSPDQDSDGMDRIVSGVDKIVLANPFGALHRKIIPSLRRFVVEYTNFYTVVCELYGGDTKDTGGTGGANAANTWLGCFERPATPAPDFEIVSFIRAGLVHLPNVVMFYMICRRAASSAIPYAQVQAQFQVCYKRIELLQGVTIKRILHIEHFPETMPMSNLPLIRHIKQIQGENQVYFAGQWLGHPSLETATYTGFRAAEQIFMDAHPPSSTSSTQKPLPSSLERFDQHYRQLDHHWKMKFLRQILSMPFKAVWNCLRTSWSCCQRKRSATT